MQNSFNTTLSYSIKIRDNINISKNNFLDELKEKSFHYLDGLVKKYYFNFFESIEYNRNDGKPIIFNSNYKNGLGNHKYQDILNTYYHGVDYNYKPFQLKVMYNQLNREGIKYLKQINYNFLSYGKFILKNINTEIEYKNNKILLYKPKRKISKQYKESNHNPQLTTEVVDIIKDKLYRLGLNEFQIREFIDNIKPNYGLLDNIYIDIEKYNITPKKYYFRDDNSNKKIEIDWNKSIFDLIKEYNLERFIYKKFKCPTISNFDLILDDRFISRKQDKDGLTPLINEDNTLKSQFMLDKNIGNQYFIKIKDLIGGNKTNYKIPIKYNSYTLNNIKSNKYNASPEKYGLTLRLHKNFIEFRLNITYRVETNKNKDKAIKLLSYDIGNKNPISFSVIKVDGVDYEKFLENLQVNKDLKKHKYNHSVNKTKQISKKLYYKSNIDGTNFNKALTKKDKQLAKAQQEGDKNKIGQIHKQKNVIKQYYYNRLINLLLQLKFYYGIDVFVGENLNLQATKKNNKHFNRMIGDISYGRFNALLYYKLGLAGGHQVKVSSENSSIRCSHCGYINKKNRATQSEFVCISCGYNDNADINATYNLVDYMFSGLVVSY